MRLLATIDQKEREIRLEDDVSGRNIREFQVDGAKATADCAEIEPGVYSILFGTRSYEVKIEGQGVYFVAVDGRRFEIAIRDPRRRVAGEGKISGGSSLQITAPMPGRVVRVLAFPGDAVQSGQAVVVVEAMKMQNEIRSPRAGLLKSLTVREGSSVAAGTVLAEVE
jgi:biotin carboxyl carrier protein